MLYVARTFLKYLQDISDKLSGCSLFVLRNS